MSPSDIPEVGNVFWTKTWWPFTKVELSDLPIKFPVNDVAVTFPVNVGLLAIDSVLPLRVIGAVTWYEPAEPVAPVGPVAPVSPVAPCGPTIWPTSVQLDAPLTYRSPSESTIYASLNAALVGSSSGVATDPRKWMFVPCGPVGPVGPRIEPKLSYEELMVFQK
jgi:hypothetical protein